MAEDLEEIDFDGIMEEMVTPHSLSPTLSSYNATHTA